MAVQRDTTKKSAKGSSSKRTKEEFKKPPKEEKMSWWKKFLLVIGATGTILTSGVIAKARPANAYNEVEQMQMAPFERSRIDKIAKEIAKGLAEGDVETYALIFGNEFLNSIYKLYDEYDKAREISNDKKAKEILDTITNMAVIATMAIKYIDMKPNLKESVKKIQPNFEKNYKKLKDWVIRLGIYKEGSKGGENL